MVLCSCEYITFHSLSFLAAQVQQPPLQPNPPQMPPTPTQTTHVPPSPRRPNKSLLQNSTIVPRGSINKVTTPTSAKSNSVGGSSKTALLMSPVSSNSSSSSSNGASNQRGVASKPAQPPSGPAYAIAAGGTQNSHASPTAAPIITTTISTTPLTTASQGLPSSPTLVCAGTHSSTALISGPVYHFCVPLSTTLLFT